MRTHFRTLAIAAAALALALPLAAAADGDEAADLTIGTEQVAEGKTVFANQCAQCHGSDLEGSGHFPTLVGATFQDRWDDRTVGDLHAFVAEQMPLGAGGTLSDEAYAAVVAYLLERNGFEPGEVPFDPSDEAVRTLELTFPE